MKNNRFLYLMILATAALAGACGTQGYYTSSVYDDGIYYRPTASSRAQTIAAREAQREKERLSRPDQYLAKDEDGNLYVVTELLDGETYESRLRKFDSPYYVSYAWYDNWGSPWYGPWYGAWHNTWYNPWWGSWRYGFGPYYSWYAPYSYLSWYDPWYWGVGGFAGWYGHNYWYHWGPSGWHHPTPGPRPGSVRNTVYTPRNSAVGNGNYRTAGSGTVNGSRGIYTTTQRATANDRNSGTVRTTGSTGNRTNSGYPVRTGAGSSNATRSAGSYGSSGATRSSGTSVSGGNHSGGGRR